MNLTGGQYGVLALRLSDGVERQHGRVFATELTLSNSSTTDNTGQFDSNCHLHNEQNPGYKHSLDEDLYYHGGPKVKEDKKKTKANEQHQLKPDHHRKENGHRAMSDETVVDVEPLIPLIKTRG